jgi:hypothetical protein
MYVGTGYPEFTIYAVLTVGVFLALLRPYWAFLGLIVLFSSLQVYGAVYTRTSLFGPYMNLYDALFLVGLVVVISDPKSKPLVLPRPVLWVLIILLIGFTQTAMLHSVNYQVVRALRWSLSFPLAFFIGANMVVDQDRAKTYLYAIIIGAAIGSLASFVDYKYIVAAEADQEAARLATAEKGLTIYLMVAAILQPFFKDRKRSVQLLWAGALILFASCVLFGQWRATFLAIIIAVVALPLLLGKLHYYVRITKFSLIGVPLILLFLVLAFPKIEISSFFDRYGTKIDDYSLKNKLNISRYNQIEADLALWYDSNWLTGRGLSFSSFVKGTRNKIISWGHVGYTSYLSNLGLIGLFIYGFYIPFKMFGSSKRLYTENAEWSIHLLGLLGCVTVIMFTVLSCTSSSYLSPLAHNIGFLYGAIWTLTYGKS